jgi:hypothetical protein
MFSLWNSIHGILYRVSVGKCERWANCEQLKKPMTEAFFFQKLLPGHLTPRVSTRILRP